MYDPCPIGWRVPDGGQLGVWSTATGSSERFEDGNWILYKEGMNFSGKFGADETIWYPASGYRTNTGLKNVGDSGIYWAASDSGKNAHVLYIGYTGAVVPSSDWSRGSGVSVRCIKE